MEDKNHFLEPLLERAETYGKTTYELFKLKTFDKAADIISTFVSRIMVIAVVSVFMFFVNIGVALWLGDLLGKSYYGFFCLAGVYGLIGFTLYCFMNTYIKKRICNSIILQMLN